MLFGEPETAKKLFQLGIQTIGELAQADPLLLRTHLKKQGEVVWAFANGIDSSGVDPKPFPNKGYGNSTTISFDVTDAQTAKLVLLALAETLGTRIRADGIKVEVVSVGIKDCNLHYSSHQKVLGSATCITKEIHQAACGLQQAED